jgi:uncharacterized RDD family membrane protein YckC
MMQAAGALLFETPEGIHFKLPLAGPVARFLAWMLDALCVAAVGSFLHKLIALAGLISADLASAVGLVVFYLVFVGYSIVLEWALRGQTLGKRLLYLRVVDASGRRLSFSQVVVRNLLRAADMLPVAYALGGICSVLTRHGQRLGDLAAGTVVVETEQSELPRLQAFDGSEHDGTRFNSIRQRRWLVARLRQALGPDEARLAFEAVSRREELAPDARIALFGELALTLKELVRFPPECLLGLSDERLVVDVVESLSAEEG